MKLFGNSHKKKSSARPARPAERYDRQYSQPEREEYEPRPRAAQPRPYEQDTPTRRPAQPEQQRRHDEDATREYRAARQQAGRGGKPVKYTKAAAKFAGYDGYEPYRTEADKRRIEAMIASYQKKKLIRRIIILVVIVALVVAGVILWKSWVKPPEHSPAAPVTSPGATGSADPGDQTASVSPEQPSSLYRKDGVYTFLLLGNDDDNGNTDTMIVGSFDTVNHKLNCVSIPRDTLVNISFWLKKVNLVMSQTDMEGLKDELARIMGFRVDSYASVDLAAFVKLVDTVDGVDFDVPVDMDYEDPLQNLYIHVPAGYQHLTGSQAVGVVRFRSGYANADIGRISTQQAFLKALAKKCLSLSNIVTKADDYAAIFKEYVDTDLTMGNIIWYLQEFSKLTEEDINFYTMPAIYDDYINNSWYVTITPNEWVDMINQYLNPLKEDIRVENLGIMARDSNGNLYMTNGEEMYTNFSKSGGSSSGGSGGGAAQPEPSAEPSTEPSAEPSTEPSDSPEPSGGEEPTVDPNPSESAQPSAEPSDSPEPSPETSDAPTQ